MKFDSYHPAINLVFFVAVIAMTIGFTQPVFLGISYISAFAYSVKLNGKRGLVFDLCLVVFVAAWTWFFSAFNHFGITNIGRTIAGNQMTLESVVFGFVIGVIIAAVLMWLSCMHAVVSSDKVVYLFGRVSPKLSLGLSIVLRMVPMIKRHAAKLDGAQKCIGRGSGQGNLLRRVRNALGRFSIMTTWTTESMAQSSDSMRSRGYALRGRTAFSIYRFDNRDRSFVIFLFLCIFVVVMGALLNQTTISYSPAILMNRITATSYVFYVAYAALCLSPLVLQTVGEVRFARLRAGA